MKDVKKFIRKEFINEVDEIKDPMSELSKSEQLNSVLLKTKIDFNKEYKEPPAYLSIKNDNDFYVTTFTPSNISAITGKAKSRKTFFQTLLIASAVINNEIQDTIKSNLPNNKRNIVLFDTEQSEFHTAKLGKRIETLIGYKPNNLHIYSLRGLTAELIMDLLRHVIYEIKNIGILFIDQIADLARSINNEEEAVSIVRTLEKITKDNDIHICCVIHQNKNDSFATGWLGSQIMKKSETVISVEKDADNKKYSHIKPDLTRNEDFKEFDIEILNGLPEIVRPIQLRVLNEDIEYLEQSDAPF